LVEAKNAGGNDNAAGIRESEGRSDGSRVAKPPGVFLYGICTVVDSIDPDSGGKDVPSTTGVSDSATEVRKAEKCRCCNSFIGKLLKKSAS
jgi:hypothetical protein